MRWLCLPASPAPPRVRNRRLAFVRMLCLQMLRIRKNPLCFCFVLFACFVWLFWCCLCVCFYNKTTWMSVFEVEKMSQIRGAAITMRYIMYNLPHLPGATATCCPGSNAVRGEARWSSSQVTKVRESSDKSSAPRVTCRAAPISGRE